MGKGTRLARESMQPRDVRIVFGRVAEGYLGRKEVCGGENGGRGALL